MAGADHFDRTPIEFFIQRVSYYNTESSIGTQVLKADEIAEVTVRSFAEGNMSAMIFVFVVRVVRTGGNTNHRILVVGEMLVLCNGFNKCFEPERIPDIYGRRRPNGQRQVNGDFLERIQAGEIPKQRVAAYAV